MLNDFVLKKKITQEVNCKELCDGFLKKYGHKLYGVKKLFNVDMYDIFT